MSCTIEATKLTTGTDRHEATRGLFATAELLVAIGWAVCGRLKPGHESTTVVFSVKCLIR